jgi:hypothetical protein
VAVGALCSWVVQQHCCPLLHGAITEKQDQLRNCICKKISDFICVYVWVFWFEVCFKVPSMIFKRISVSHISVHQKRSAVTLYIYCWAVWCSIGIVLHFYVP